ncbi:MAG: cobalamin-binding protein [Desulfobacterales bacterium]|nr:cobalamin-binding protein [Desulfobacterales bacterium]
MKRRSRVIRLVLAGALLFGLQTAAAASAAAEQRKVVDPTGRTVQVPADPRRVVALAPSVTEIVYALGQETRLVGVTRYSNYPPAAERLPLVGSYIQLDVERIVALRPDLCIAVKDGNPIAAVEQLESLGVAVFAINPQDLETIMQSVTAVGGLLGAEERAQTVVGDMRRRIEKVQARVAQTTRRPTLFFQIGVSPIVSVGSNTFIHTLIELAGGVNVAAGPSPYPRFSREQVIALAPEVIVISAMERAAQFEQVKAEWMQWPAIPAVKSQAVFIAPNDLFERPSPRLVEALETLAAFLHPELFKERP